MGRVRHFWSVIKCWRNSKWRLRQRKPKNVGRENNVLWKGLISPGYLPNDDEIANFKGSKGLIYRINYHSKRHVRATDSPVHKPQYIDVMCSVKKSTLNKPLFECTFALNTESKHIIATNPTRAANVALKLLGHSKKQWSGNEFFGFRREDVKKAIAAHDEKQQTIPFELNETYAVPNTGTNTKISWIGVKSYGRPVENEKYMYRVGTHVCRLQPGYTSIREVACSDGKRFDLI